MRSTRACALLGPSTRRPSSTNRRVPMPRTRKHPTEKDALSLLKEDHRKVRGLLAQLAESSERATTKREERKLYFEAQEEHHVVDTVLPELKSTDPASETFAAKAKVLKDLVEHHAEEEETEMFPRSRKLLGRDELVRLGEELAQAKVSLTERVLTKLVELVRP